MGFYFGRGRKIRTLDTRFWRPLLYQLSYTPVWWAFSRCAAKVAGGKFCSTESPTKKLSLQAQADWQGFEPLYSVNSCRKNNCVLVVVGLRGLEPGTGRL